MTAPAIRPAPEPHRADPRRDWRAPTTGEHVCVTCFAAAGFGLHGSWFCRACVPPGFLPQDRETHR